MTLCILLRHLLDERLEVWLVLHIAGNETECQLVCHEVLSQVLKSAIVDIPLQA